MCPPSILEEYNLVTVHIGEGRRAIPEAVGKTARTSELTRQTRYLDPWLKEYSSACYGPVCRDLM